MDRLRPRHFNLYNEVCPASSAAAIGAGIIAITMGSVPVGTTIVLSGIVIGIARPLAQTVLRCRDGIRRYTSADFRGRK